MHGLKPLVVAIATTAILTPAVSADQNIDPTVEVNTTVTHTNTIYTPVGVAPRGAGDTPTVVTPVAGVETAEVDTTPFLTGAYEMVYNEMDKYMSHVTASAVAGVVLVAFFPIVAIAYVVQGVGSA